MFLAIVNFSAEGGRGTRRYLRSPIQSFRVVWPLHRPLSVASFLVPMRVRNCRESGMVLGTMERAFWAMVINVFPSIDILFILISLQPP